MLSEVHASYLKKGFGPTRGEIVTLFSGLFIVADFHKDFHEKTLVLTENETGLFGFINTVKRQLKDSPQCIHLEDPEFEQHFKVLGTDPIEARYILTPDIMKRMTELRQKTKSSIHFPLSNHASTLPFHSHTI